MIIYNKVIRGIHKYDKVLIYVSKENEVDTINIIKYCLHNNIKVAVPKCNNNEMLFYYIDSLDELSLNKYNILEPNNKRLVRSYKNSICITPSILLDNKGNRIYYKDVDKIIQKVYDFNDENEYLKASIKFEKEGYYIDIDVINDDNFNVNNQLKIR